MYQRHRDIGRPARGVGAGGVGRHVLAVLDAITAADLDGIAVARAAAREVAWAQRAEETGAALPASMVVGAPLLDRDGRPVLVIDEAATIVVAHSEKEQAAATFKHSFGFHPVLAFCDNSNEALAGMLRPGNAGSNTMPT